MAKRSKSEIEECKRRLVEALVPCTAMGKSTLLLIVSNWRNTSTSILICDIEARIITTHQGRPVPTAYLNNLIHDALGIRQAKSNMLTYSGYGYCRTDELAKQLAHLVGAPIFVHQIGESVGPQGWVNP